MDKLYELREKLCEELKQYSKKDISAGTLDIIDKLAHAVKNIDKIIENNESGGYSNDYMGPNMVRRGVPRDGRYNGDINVARSYKRGRDAMGRYVSRENGYSYDGNMVSELHELMEETTNDQIKQKLKRLIAEIESM